MAFYVEDENAGTTGTYATLNEALVHANNDLAIYRKDAAWDGWGVGESGLCIYEAEDGAEDPTEGRLVAKSVEFNKEAIPAGEYSYGFEYVCDMKMEIVPRAPDRIRGDRQ